jgi:hypothetical protein
MVPMARNTMVMMIKMMKMMKMIPGHGVREQADLLPVEMAGMVTGMEVVAIASSWKWVV